MNRLTPTLGALCVAAGLSAWPAAAETGGPDFGFDVNAGYRYDSNVNIADLDKSTGRGDTALVMDLGVDGSLPLSGSLTMDVGYSYAGTRYRNLDDFDFALHRLHGALGYRFAGLESALSVDRFAARLDDEAYLEVTRISPSLARLFGDWLYLRGSFARSEKSYDDYADRDAVNDALRADAYLLIDGMQRYIALTFERDAEDALTDSLDYDGISTKLAYGHRLESGAFSLLLKGHLQLEDRDYARLPDMDEAPRRDERLRAGLSAALPLSEYFELTGQAEYSDNGSTLESAVYDEIVYTVSFGLSF